MKQRWVTQGRITPHCNDPDYWHDLRAYRTRKDAIKHFRPKVAAMLKNAEFRIVLKEMM
jgi:hypothetical protein